jgi:hypothetical protein
MQRILDSRAPLVLRNLGETAPFLRSTLDEILSHNDFADAERAELIDDLTRTGRALIGGGAAPAIEITLGEGALVAAPIWS